MFLLPNYKLNHSWFMFAKRTGRKTKPLHSTFIPLTPAIALWLQSTHPAGRVAES
jgi:hypothetical protein